MSHGVVVLRAVSLQRYQTVPRNAAVKMGVKMGGGRGILQLVYTILTLALSYPNTHFWVWTDMIEASQKLLLGPREEAFAVENFVGSEKPRDHNLGRFSQAMWRMLLGLMVFGVVCCTSFLPTTASTAGQ